MDYDVIVIGSGPGGYVAAIRASQLGLKTACIEKYPTLGGTCLNVGCIPSKAMLHSSELYHQATADLANHGIVTGQVKLDLDKMLARKVDVVKNLTGGISGLFKKNKITEIHGMGKLVGDHKVEVTADVGSTSTISGKHIIIATGSKPVELPFLKFDDDIVSSTGALAFDKVPEHLVVIGGGVIGLELGSVWLRLGAKVTVVEFMDRILPPMDSAVSKEMKKLLTRQGMKFHLGAKVTGATREGEILKVTAEDKKGKEIVLEADKILVSVGRRPFTEGLGLDEVGIATNKQGFIEVDEHFKTGVDGIYAIGDVIPGPMLAHKAEEEGIAAAEIIAGKAGHVNYETVPNIVYTWPEVGAVGKTEEELKEAGVPYNVGKFSFKANSRGRCTGDNNGLVKILAHKDTDRILGAHIVGPHASELIAEVVAIMEFHGSAEDLARTFHGHPTLTEAIKEAALDVDNRAIHA